MQPGQTVYSTRAREALIAAMAADLVTLRRQHGAANRGDLAAMGWTEAEIGALGFRAAALAADVERRPA
jgi:hypothetical protein